MPVLVWDFIDEHVLQEYDAKAPVLWMESSASCPSRLTMVISDAAAKRKASVSTQPNDNDDKDDDDKDRVAHLGAKWSLTEC